jgi:hypothetical protein
MLPALRYALVNHFNATTGAWLRDGSVRYRPAAAPNDESAALKVLLENFAIVVHVCSRGLLEIHLSNSAHR